LQIKEAISVGQLTQEQYQAAILKQRKKDGIMIQYFTATKEQVKLRVVQERYNCICTELGNTAEVVPVQAVAATANAQPPVGVDKVSLDDPTEVTNMVCMSHLQQVIDQYDTQIKAAQAAEVRIDPYIRKKWMECKKTMMQI